MNSVDKLNSSLKKINSEYIANHYDDIVENAHMYTTEKYMTNNLRRINNFIKAGILRSYVKKGDAVLDLGCGKGGDLKKYQSLKISKYLGLDVSEKSIKEAVDRTKALKPSFITRFCIKDAYNDLLDGNSEFDIITSQFSFHYAFFDDKSLSTAVNNISKNLKVDGFFICTVPKKNIIVNRILKHRAYNSLYSITDVFPKSSNSDLWKGYTFSLMGSVHGCIEYFVNFLKLKKMLEDEKIYLVQRTSFVSALEQYKTSYPQLFTQMKIQNPTTEDANVIGLYEILVFQKILTNKLELYLRQAAAHNKKY